MAIGVNGCLGQHARGLVEVLSGNHSDFVIIQNQKMAGNIAQDLPVDYNHVMIIPYVED